MSRIERRYRFPGLMGHFARAMADTLHDAYGLLCQPVDPSSKLAYGQCRHTAIYAVSLCPALGVAIFSNPDGLALPVHVKNDDRRRTFQFLLAEAPAYELGKVRGAGRFMPDLRDLGAGICIYRAESGDEARSAPWSKFVTYYFADLEGVKFLQDGPYPGGPNAGFRENPAQSSEEWRQLCKEREAVRAWLEGDTPPASEEKQSKARKATAPRQAAATPAATSLPPEGPLWEQPEAPATPSGEPPAAATQPTPEPPRWLNT